MKPEDVSAVFFRVLGAALNLPPQDLDATASRQTLALWDSIRHMQVMLALEDELGIEFTDVEIAKLDAAPAVIAVIADKLRGR